MGLQDYTYRIKAQAGDTTIHDEKGVSGDMSGGTQTLVDMGSGDYAWEIASGRASVAVPSKTFDPAVTGSGVTIAVRMAITSYDASSFAFLAGWATDAAATPSKGLCLGQAGTNIVRSRWIDVAPDTLSMLTVNNAVRTYVLRATSPASGLEKLYAWVSGLTGSGDTADYISSGQNYNSAALDTALLGSSGSTIRVSDFVIWPEELTDAQCHALAEDLRGTLDVGGDGTASGVTLSATASLITGSASGSSGSTASGVTLTATASLIAGAATGSGNATASGVTLTATGSLIPGSASGVINGVLSFQATGMEFGARTGLEIDTFALDAGVSYRYSVHADGLTLGSAILTSAAITLDGAGKLPNLVSNLLTPGTTYRVFAIRQTDGEAATFRLTAS